MKNTATDQWSFPHMVMDPANHKKVKSTDTTPIMKKYAMQSVKESAGAPLSKYMLPQIGGAPIGFHWSTHGEGGVHFGTKDYFFKAQCYPRFGKEWPRIQHEHLWVTREEMKEYMVDDEAFLRHVEHLL